MKEGQSKGSDLFLKITYKGNTFNFGKDIHSYQQLVKSTILRFPQLNKLSFYFKQQLVTEHNFCTFINLQFTQGQKSIKLQLKQSSSQKQVAKSKKYSFNPHQFHNQTKKYSFNADQFHDEEQNKQQKSLQKEFQVLKLSQQKVQKEPKSIDPSKINIKVLISKEFQSIQANLSVQYFWKCILVNFSGFDINQKLFIKDLYNQDLIEIKNLKNSQSRQFTFGPYSEKQLGKHLHFYQILSKKNEQQFIPIGNKFGFMCEIKKKLIVKEIQNKVVQRINKIKSFCVCQKTTQYIVKSLKQLNITDDSIDGFKDQDLIDLIESLNTQ